jgi:hypothetical protein
MQHRLHCQAYRIRYNTQQQFRKATASPRLHRSCRSCIASIGYILVARFGRLRNDKIGVVAGSWYMVGRDGRVATVAQEKYFEPRWAEIREGSEERTESSGGNRELIFVNE